MGYMMQKWRQIVMSMPHKNTVSGNPVVIKPTEPKLEALKVTFEPSQSGSGTPSSSNVRTIYGWNAIPIKIGGKNLFDYQNTTIADKKIRNNSGVETADSYEQYTQTAIQVAPGSTITISGLPNSTNTKRVYYLDQRMQWIMRDDHSRDKIKFTITIPDNCAYIQLQLRRTEADWSTVQIEYSATATAYESYNSAVQVVSFPSQQTFYGGVVDFVTGSLTVTWGYISSYAGETLPGRWISSKNAYSANGTPTTGAQVAYVLATPQTYQLTPNAFSVERELKYVSTWCKSVEVSYWTH